MTSDVLVQFGASLLGSVCQPSHSLLLRPVWLNPFLVRPMGGGPMVLLHLARHSAPFRRASYLCVVCGCFRVVFCLGWVAWSHARADCKPCRTAVAEPWPWPEGRRRTSADSLRLWTNRTGVAGPSKDFQGLAKTFQGSRTPAASRNLTRVSRAVPGPSKVSKGAQLASRDLPRAPTRLPSVVEGSPKGRMGLPTLSRGF